MPNNLDYRIVLEPLSVDDGGGFLAMVPDLPGCMSDGESQEEALASVRDAIDAWLDEARRLQRPIPSPSRANMAAE